MPESCELPDYHEVTAYLVPKPDQTEVIEWLEEVLGFIKTEAYSL